MALLLAFRTNWVDLFRQFCYFVPIYISRGPYVIPMVYIVGASSLHATVESTTYKFRKKNSELHYRNTRSQFLSQLETEKFAASYIPRKTEISTQPAPLARPDK